MSRSNSQPSQIDSFVKPKPGQKKAANNESSQSQSKSANPHAQTSYQGSYPPPPHQQKLVLCKYYESGLCQRGSKCWYAHGKEELRNPHKHASRQEAHALKSAAYDQDLQDQCPDQAVFKTRMCTYFQQGRCQRGATCTFAHDPAELQAYNPARRYAQQGHVSPPHTMDKFLPQRLQDEAAASIASKQAAASPASNQRRDKASHAAPPPAGMSTTASTSPDAATSLTQAYGPAQSSAMKSVANAPGQSPTTPMPNDATKANKPAKHTVQNKNLDGHGVDRGSNGVVGTNAVDGQPVHNGKSADIDVDDRGYVDDLEAPSSFCCPITTELLRDPVVAADGHTYERQHIAEWLQKSDTSPMTNAPMEHKLLTSNIALRNVMNAYFGVRGASLQHLVTP